MKAGDIFLSNNIILYSTHCPRCNVLEQKLKSKKIPYTEVNDTEIMLQKGFNTVPVLEINGTVLDFKEANNWINNQEQQMGDSV